MTTVNFTDIQYEDIGCLIDLWCILTIKFHRILSFYREKKLVTTLLSIKLRYNSHRYQCEESLHSRY